MPSSNDCRPAWSSIATTDQLSIGAYRTRPRPVAGDEDRAATRGRSHVRIVRHVHTLVSSAIALGVANAILRQLGRDDGTRGRRGRRPASIFSAAWTRRSRSGSKYGFQRCANCSRPRTARARPRPRCWVAALGKLPCRVAMRPLTPRLRSLRELAPHNYQRTERGTSTALTMTAVRCLDPERGRIDGQAPHHAAQVQRVDRQRLRGRGLHSCLVSLARPGRTA